MSGQIQSFLFQNISIATTTHFLLIMLALIVYQRFMESFPGNLFLFFGNVPGFVYLDVVLRTVISGIFFMEVLVFDETNILHKNVSLIIFLLELLDYAGELVLDLLVLADSVYFIKQMFLCAKWVFQEMLFVVWKPLFAQSAHLDWNRVESDGFPFFSRPLIEVLELGYLTGPNHFLKLDLELLFYVAHVDEGLLDVGILEMNPLEIIVVGFLSVACMGVAPFNVGLEIVSLEKRFQSVFLGRFEETLIARNGASLISFPCRKPKRIDTALVFLVERLLVGARKFIQKTAEVCLCLFL